MISLSQHEGSEMPVGFDLETFRRWLAHQTGISEHAPIAIVPCSGSRLPSNWIVTFGDSEWILRQRDGGQQMAGRALDLAGGQHVPWADTETDVPDLYEPLHEFRALEALAKHPVPAPEPIAYCSDPTVSEAPFFLMERCDGLIVRSQIHLADLSEDECRQASRQIVDRLAELHSIHDRDLENMSIRVRPGLADRTEAMAMAWERHQRREIPAVDELLRLLRRAVPPPRPIAMTHGDYRIDNVVLDERDRGAVRAVIDWECAALDDPLIDLGFLLAFWGYNEPALEFVSPVIWALDGFLPPDEMVQRYAEATGTDPSDIDFYVVLGLTRCVMITHLVVVPQVSTRQDVTEDQVVALEAAVERLAERALEMARSAALGERR